MSGWDVSSTPTWGPQDGPEDSHPGHGEGSREFGQDFGPHDFGRGGPNSPAGGFPEVGGGFPGESQAGGPPPEFFGQDYGQEHEVGPGGFPQRTPGRSFQDLPRRESRGRHSSAPGGGYGQESPFGQDGAFGQANGYGGPAQDNGYGAPAQDNGFGQDNGYGHAQDNGFAQDNGYGHAPDNGFAQEGSYGQDGGYREWGGNPEQADTWGPGNGGQDNDGGWGRPAGRSAAPWEERPQQDAGYPGPDAGQEFGQQDFGRQDYPRQAQRPSFGAQDYDGQDFPGQQELDPGFDRGERDVTARMDPALQDFFAPQRGGAPGYPGQGPGRSAEPRDPSRYRPPTDGWEDPGRPRGGTGPRPAARGPRRDEPEPRGGIGMRGLIAIGAVVAVIVVIAVVVLTHKSGGGTPAASNTPSGGTPTSAAAKPTASKAAAGSGTATKPAAGAAAAAGAYTLSAPATAGGYPMGQDPQFLAASTATAKQITDAVTAGGGGTVTGTPVSAAYRLPASQVITFVGYQGTFTPAKVQTILATLGNDPKAYPPGPNGGLLGCANTKATPSAAVCVWATGSTLGVTEFYTSTGPETLNAAQVKGADDTVNLRADVEKKK